MEDSAIPSLLARLRRNMGWLAGGAAGASILGIFTLALLTRGLDPTAFGLFALAQSYVIVLGRLLSFDTWLGLTRFGGEAQARGDTARLRAVCNAGFGLDMLSALAAGTTGLALLALFAEGLALSGTLRWAAAFYIASLFFQLPSMPIGTMRLFNRFSWLAGVTLVEAAAKLAAAGVLFAGGAALADYLYAFGAVAIALGVTRTALAVRIVRSETGPLLSGSARELRSILTPFVRFSLGSWMTGTMNVARRDGTVLVVAGVLGPAAAGLYAAAQRIVRPANDLAEMVRQAVFPDLSRFVAAGRHGDARTFIRRLLSFTLPIALIVAFGTAALGAPVLRLVAGPAYEEAYWILVALGGAASLYLCFPLLSSLVILYAGMRSYVLATAAATIVWAATFTVPMMAWGADGAGLGQLVFVAAWSFLGAWLLRRTTRARAPKAASSATSQRRAGR